MWHEFGWSQRLYWSWFTEWQWNVVLNIAYYGGNSEHNNYPPRRSVAIFVLSLIGSLVLPCSTSAYMKGRQLVDWGIGFGLQSLCLEHWDSLWQSVICPAWRSGNTIRQVRMTFRFLSTAHYRVCIVAWTDALKRIVIHMVYALLKLQIMT